ncbi:MAG TPA: hypothetical protein VGJ15_11495, partial [Pirellulales bacterium]
AMDAWEEVPADAAAAALARADSVGDAFELLFRYGCRDFRDIGHKAIYVSNSWRALNAIGIDHAEPVIRSLAYALLYRDNDSKDADAPADRPIKRNRELAEKIPDTWQNGKIDEQATREMLAALREHSDEDCCQLTVEMLNRGVAPQSIWDALMVGAGELLMRQPGIVALHAVTSTNALNFAYRTAASDQTRRLLLLQNAAFVPLFRQAMTQRGKIGAERADQLEPASIDAKNPSAIEEIFAAVGRNNAEAARKVFGYLDSGGDPQTFSDAARLLIFTKGNNAHDYKFSAAVLEDYGHVSHAWRNRYLATSVYNLRGSSQADNKLVDRVRSALRA